MDQHIVTRSYLTAFCDSGLSRPSVWVVDLRQGQIRCAGPRNVATEVDYYSHTMPDGTINDGVEKVLHMVETHAAPILRNLRAGMFSLSSDDRGILAMFTALMLVRVRAFRDRVEALGAQAATALLRTAARLPNYFDERFYQRHGLTTTPEKQQQFREALSQATVTVDHEFSLQYILGAASVLESMLLDMGWTFLVSKGTPFITSDTPVTKTSERVLRRRPVGLKDADIEVTFPISSSVCLLVRWATDLNVRDVGESDVARVNRDRVRYAHEQVFASSQAAARSARAMYTKLRDRGEAHVKPVNLMIAEGEGPPRPV